MSICTPSDVTFFSKQLLILEKIRNNYLSTTYSLVQQNFPPEMAAEPIEEIEVGTILNRTDNQAEKEPASITFINVCHKRKEPEQQFQSEAFQQKKESKILIREITCPNGQKRFSVYDFMTMVCEYAPASATKEFHRMIADDAEHKKEILDLCEYLKFPGRGQRETPTMTLMGLHKLLVFLGGKASTAARDIAYDVLERYLNGDTSLCSEIENNRAIGIEKSLLNFAEKLQERIEWNDKHNCKPNLAYVYGTKSAAFPGLIKIGKTENMTNRLISLNTSCAPAPHVLIALAPSLNHQRDELLTHAFFAEFRKEGEFFEISEDMLKDYFTSVIVPRYNTEMAIFCSGSP